MVLKTNIQPDQTVILTRLLPGLITVNNLGASVTWIMSNKSNRTVHFNTLPGEVYGFLF